MSLHAMTMACSSFQREEQDDSVDKDGQRIETKLIHPHELARDLHTRESYFLLDCRPLLAYNTCHITGAVNVNFTGMMKKRFMSGKIGLYDLVPTEEGREKFKNCVNWPTVVYDECTADLQGLSASQSVSLVVAALEKMGKCPFLLQGGLSEFNVLHPSLCEISVPILKQSLNSGVSLRATTPGVRDQALDWMTAPPVHVLSYLVLGSEKDAKSREVFKSFGIKHVLNVTPKCPNHFEDHNVKYKRISVIDTGSQKLSNYFQEAFAFVEEARRRDSVVLIHCMAGVSRSVTLTIAYLMFHFGMSMQDAYQFVKDKRPAISPNLNFMGQLVQFEKELLSSPNNAQKLDISVYLPTSEQVELSEVIRQSSSAGGSSAHSTPEPRSAGGNTSSATAEKSCQPFLLKMPKPRKQKQKTEAAHPENDLAKQHGDGVNIVSSHTSPSCNIPAQLGSVNEPTTCTLFPNQLSSLSVANKSSLSTPSSSTSNNSSPSVVKDIIRKFEKSD